MNMETVVSASCLKPRAALFNHLLLENSGGSIDIDDRCKVWEGTEFMCKMMESCMLPAAGRLGEATETEYSWA